jgi:hypothetical protein
VSVTLDICTLDRTLARGPLARVSAVAIEEIAAQVRALALPARVFR